MGMVWVGKSGWLHTLKGNEVAEHMELLQPLVHRNHEQSPTAQGFM